MTQWEREKGNCFYQEHVCANVKFQTLEKGLSSSLFVKLFLLVILQLNYAHINIHIFSIYLLKTHFSSLFNIFSGNHFVLHLAFLLGFCEP